MEAVPRMPMLAFELKNCPEPVEFAATLLSYVREFYNEDPESYTKECAEIDQLRQVAVRVSRDFMGCSTLKKYYSQLHFLQSRFPMGEGGVVALPFTWEDVFSGRSVTMADIRFEQACILYNIGALHSVLGALDNRQTPEGMKVSCTHFQCAAWAFEHLRDYFGSSMSIDMNHDLLTFQVNLMLAQAQECILEKSMTDNRKSSITAKVASQIVEYYRLALKNLDATDPSNLLGSRKYKEWKKRIDLRVNYHQCITFMYQGQQSEDQQRWGERYAFYQASLDKLNECIKLNKDEENDINESLRFTMDVVGGRYNAAKKDNDFVYHEKVPEIDSLPDVKGASLVKGIPFNIDDREVSGPDIFQRLVPMEAHEASSLYSEEKAKLLRCIGTRVEDKNNELSHYMGSLQVDPDMISPQAERLPQHLLEKCAAISVKPSAIPDLVASMTSLSSVATDVESNIHEIMDLLETEAKQEAEHQKIFGKRRINVVLEEIEKECKKYEEGLTKASLSNQELHKAMNTHISNLKLLSGSLDELQNSLPSVELERSPEDEAMAKEVKRLLEKVEEMKKQRESLSEQLRQQVHSDDITTDIVTRDEGDQEEFFKKQISKHDKIVNLIDQNINAQDNILHALTEANANFAAVRKSNTETNTKRDQVIKSLVQSYDVYEDLLAKSQKGVEFYKKLETNVARLLTRTRGVCKVQQEEREMALARIKPKEPPPSRPTAPKPGQHPTLGTDPSMIPGALPGALPGGLPPLHGQLPGQVPGAMPDMGLPGGVPSALEAAMRLAQDPHGAARGANIGLPPSRVSAPPAPLPPTAGVGDTPRLTLKDYLPFMKPKSFGGDRGAPRLDAAAAMGAMGGYPGTSLSQVPSLPPLSGSVPNSQSASPIHLPTQAASQPASPHHTPGRPGPDAPPDQPQHPASLPRPSSASPVPPLHHPALAQGGIGAAGGGIPPEMVTSPTAAPGAPSARRQSPAAGVPAGIPPGAPTAAGQPPVGYGPYGHYPQGYPQGIPHVQPAAQHIPSANLAMQQHPHGAQLQGPGPVAPPPASVPHLPTGQMHPTMPPTSQYHGQQMQAANIPTYPSPAPSPHQHPAPSPSPQPPPHPSPAPSPQFPQPAPGQAPPPQGYAMPQQPPAASHPPQMNTGAGAGYPSQARPAARQAVPSNSFSGRPQAYPNQQGYHHTIPAHSQAGVANQQPMATKESGMPGMPVQGGAMSYPHQPPQQLPSPGTHQLPRQQLAPVSQHTAAGTVGGGYNMPGMPSGTSAAQTHLATGQPVGQGASVSQQQQQPRYPGYPTPQGQPGPQYQTPSPTPVSQSSAYQPLQGGGSSVPTTYQGGPNLPSMAPGQIGAPLPNQGAPTGAQRPQAQSQNAMPQAPAASGQGQTPQQFQTGAPGQAGQVRPQSGVTQNSYGYQQPPFGGNQGYQQQQVNMPRPQQPSSYSAGGAGAGQMPYQAQTSSQNIAHSTSNAAPQHFTQSQSGGQHGAPGNTGQPTQAPQQPRQQQPSYPAAQSSMNNMYGPQAGNSQYTQATGQYPQYPQQQQQQQQISQAPQPQQQQHHNQQQPARQYQQTGQQQPAQQQQGVNQAPPQQQQQQPTPHQPQQPRQVPAAFPGYPSVSASGQPQGQAPVHGQAPYNAQGGPRPPVALVGQPQQPNQQWRGQAPGSYQPQQNQQNQYRQPAPAPQQQPQNQPRPQGYPQQQQPQTGYQQQGYNQTPPNNLSLQSNVVTPTNVNLPSPLQPTPAVRPADPQPTAAQQPPAAPQTPEPRSNSLPPVVGQPELAARQESTLSAASSLDDILSSSPDASKGQASTLPGVLKPKVITADDIRRQKEEEAKNRFKNTRDPYADKEVLDRFTVEVENFAKQVEALCKQTLSGPTPLDKEWKELGDEQEKISRQNGMAIARCYPMKNRFQDIMPYDNTRVVLTSGNDDYINATNIDDLSLSSPKFIVTQAPIPATTVDFWQMISEQSVEVVVMLCQENEHGKHKTYSYWPTEKGQPVNHGPYQLTLQSVKVKPGWEERILTFSNRDTHQSRSVVHLQYNKWPTSGVPESPVELLGFINEVHSFYIQQRSLMKPVVVHCSNGVGRSGTFCVIYTGVEEINLGRGIINVGNVVLMARQKRKYMVQEKEQLKFIYDAILYYSQDLLMKRGILTNRASFGDKLPQPGERGHHRTPSEDFIMSTTSSLKDIQSSVARMSVKPPKADDLPNGTQNATDNGACNGDGPQITTPPVFDQQTPVTSGGSEPALSVGAHFTTGPAGSPSVGRSRAGTEHSDSPVDRSRSGSACSEISHQSGVGSLSASPQHKPPAAAAAGLPLSLADIQNPNTFTLDRTPPTKRKITKASFDNPAGSITEVAKDTSDPLNMLDPLWSVKPEKQS